MMKVRLLILLCSWNVALFAQSQQINDAMKKLAADEQFRYATMALVVKDATTGETIYKQNEDVGMVPASSLKVVTSATAFALLGKDFSFSTSFSLAASPDNLEQALLIDGWGDPTLGSDRWKQTKASNILSTISDALKKHKIEELPGGIFIDDLNYTYQPVPAGWVWEDIGNYFGAGAWGLNWKENVFEIDLLPGKDSGDPATVIATRPAWLKENLTSFVKTAASGSGDQSLVFSAPYQKDIFITGTIPAGGKITIKASMPDPAKVFGRELREHLQKAGIVCGPVQTLSERLRLGKPLHIVTSQHLGTLTSPSFDSMSYWFMNKSINLYGEALVKMIALQQKKEASTENGVEVIRNFWQGKGIDKAALKIGDGSGLTPANRVTANSLISVMEYAQTQPWFTSFYSSLPEMNGMKLKSGYMNGVRSYTGMVTSGRGRKFWVSFIINNFDGSPASVRQKMWKVLDELL